MTLFSLVATIVANLAVFYLVAVLLFIADRQIKLKASCIFWAAVSASYLFWFLT